MSSFFPPPLFIGALSYWQQSKWAMLRRYKGFRFVLCSLPQLHFAWFLNNSRSTEKPSCLHVQNSQLSTEFLEVCLLFDELGNSGSSRTKWTGLKEQGVEWDRRMRLSDTFRLLQITWAGFWYKGEFWCKEILAFVNGLYTETSIKILLAAGFLPKYDHPSAYKITALVLYQCS